MKFTKLAILAPAAALAIWSSPLSAHAAAAGAGAGVVQGKVTTNPGIPATGASGQADAFTQTLLQGAFADSSGNSYVGPVNVGATGLESYPTNTRSLLIGK